MMSQPESVSTSSATDCLAGGGEVGARLHALLPRRQRDGVPDARFRLVNK